MKNLPWMGACAALVLALLWTSACTEPLTNPPKNLPVDTLEDFGPDDFGRTGDVELGDYGPEGPPTGDVLIGDFGVDGPPADVLPAPEPPEVQGEPSAGHPHPTWLWSLPEGAVVFRVRIDEGPWTELPVEVRSFTAPEPLEAGAHLFEVQAANADGLRSLSGTFETTVKYFTRPGYWDGVSRDLAQTVLGNTAAISAHNCYLAFIDGPTSLEATRTLIQEAVAGGADLIELDIKEEGGEIYVDHDDDGSVDGALLAEVLDLPELQDADQLLYIEIKETAPTEAFVAALLDILDVRRAHYARNGRPVVLRTFYSRLDNVSLARELLDGGGYPLIQEYVRLSVLFGKSDFPALSLFQTRISEMAEDGYGMVEFQYQTPNLFAKIAYARSLGLGLNLWTIPKTQGAVFIGALREEVDALTTDLAVATARIAVKRDDVLVYLNTWDQTADGDEIAWHQGAEGAVQGGINGTGQPAGAAWGTGEALFGTALEFDPDAEEYLPLYDADCAPDGGVLVTAAVRFDRLDLLDGETLAILAKSDMSGWTLELHDPPGAGGAELRFGVFVADQYRYATVPADWVLNTDAGFFIIGSFNGNGPVRLWVDNVGDSIVGDEATGGVVNNDSLLLLGADPQGDAPPRYHFDGAIQQAMVLRWDSP